jgi:hypothetical protein
MHISASLVVHELLHWIALALLVLLTFVTCEQQEAETKEKDIGAEKRRHEEQLDSSRISGGDNMPGLEKEELSDGSCCENYCYNICDMERKTGPQQNCISEMIGQIFS